MRKTARLLEKLRRGIITGPELVVLLRRSGWYKIRQRGSHEVWSDGKRMLVLVAGRVDLRHYQIAEARQLLLERP